MGAEFRTYSLEDYLDDPDFCSWARSERPDLDSYYQQLLDEYPEQKKIFRKAYQIVRLFDDEKMETTLARKLQLWEEAKNLYRRQSRPLRLSGPVFKYAAAAVLLLAMVSGIYYYVTDISGKKFIASYKQQNFTETKLSLDNGNEIRIHSDQPEIVYEQNGRQLKIDDKLVSKKGETKNDDATNQLVVAFGKTSKIVLSDRTEVWLNAGSRLIYPTTFEGGKRKVRLQGEALFKVSKDKTKPFIVATDHSDIRVLGTTFNVKAYPDDKYEETVLVEGSVRLSLGNAVFGSDVLLKPDQRVVVSDADHSFTVSNVDVKNYTSWIDGLFIFTDEPLPSVLMRISRYYNVQVKWTDEAESRKISGKLDLKDNYRRVLHTLTTISDGNYEEKNGIVFFKLNNNQ